MRKLIRPLDTSFVQKMIPENDTRILSEGTSVQPVTVRYLKEISLHPLKTTMTKMSTYRQQVFLATQYEKLCTLVQSCVQKRIAKIFRLLIEGSAF